MRSAASELLHLGQKFAPIFLIFIHLASGCKTTSGGSKVLYASSNTSLEEIKSQTCKNYVKQGNCLLRLRSYVADKKTLDDFSAKFDEVFKREASAKKIERMKKLDGLLNHEEMMGIFLYTDFLFDDINSALRGTEPKFGFSYPLPDLQLAIYAAASGLTKLSKQSYQGIVYRGDGTYSNDANEFTTKVNQFLKIYEPGGLITEPTFLSTSKDQSTANAFGNPKAIEFAYTIHSKTGVPIAAVSSEKAEDEILFTAGTVFKIISMTHAPKKGGPRSYKFNIELEELDIDVVSGSNP